jgi:hypothetical protein
MKFIAGVALSVVIVASGVALYYYVSDDKRKRIPDVIMRVGRTDLGQPIFASGGGVDGMQSESDVRR